MYKPEFNSEKFRALMLYVAHKSREDPWFGAVKLNKILYYCDFQAFARLYRPITGATYMKLSEGPAPNELLRERQALVDEGLAELKLEKVFRYVQHRLVPVSKDDQFSHLFDDDELEIIEDTLRFLKPMTGKEASDMSHREVGWILARKGGSIPYETVWVMPKGSFDLAMMASSVQD